MSDIELFLFYSFNQAFIPPYIHVLDFEMIYNTKPICICVILIK